MGERMRCQSRHRGWEKTRECRQAYPLYHPFVWRTLSLHCLIPTYFGGGCCHESGIKNSSCESSKEELLLLHGSGAGLGQARIMRDNFAMIVTHIIVKRSPELSLRGSGSGSLGKAEHFVGSVAQFGSCESSKEELLLLHDTGAGLGQAHVSFDGFASKSSSGGSVFTENGSPELFLRDGVGLGQAHVGVDGFASKSSSGGSVLFEKGSPELSLFTGRELGKLDAAVSVNLSKLVVV